MCVEKRMYEGMSRIWDGAFFCSQVNRPLLGKQIVVAFFFFTSLFWFSVVSGCDFLLFLFPSYFLPCAISPCFLFFFLLWLGTS